jgi:deaminated glutathione amidase
LSTHLVAAVQLNSQTDVQANLDAVIRLTRAARKRGASLVALPENFAFVGDSDEAKLQVAEAIPTGATPAVGPIVRCLQALAKEEDVSILAGGMPELCVGAQAATHVYNTSILLDSNGACVARYRKIHLFDVELPDGSQYRESQSTARGSSVEIGSLGDLRIGLSVCYDLRFAELYRAFADAGCNVVTVPAAFTLVTGKDHWQPLLRARAIENQVYVIAPAQYGSHPRGRQTYGKSMIVNPWGDVLAQAPDGVGMALAEIDLQYLAQVRRMLPSPQHRRL